MSKSIKWEVRIIIGGLALIVIVVVYALFMNQSSKNGYRDSFLDSWQNFTAKVVGFRITASLDKLKLADLKVKKEEMTVAVTELKAEGRLPREKELIELAFSLIESIQNKNTVYSIINRYAPRLGDDKLLNILLAFDSKGNKFNTENSLAAYLEKCTKSNGRITDSVPDAIAGQPGWI